METRTRLALGAAFAAALLLTLGCEDTPVTPGEDFSMSLVARPSSVLIDATHPEGTASIVATVFSDTGVPQQGIMVIFSNSGGTLASGNSGIETDSNGNAVDTLTIDSSAPAETTVIASAGTLSQSVKVNKTATAVNRPPVATIVATPATEQAVGLLVTFDGATSSDPDTGDFIETYDWFVTSSNPDSGTNPIINHATTPSISFTSFANPQTLTVSLVVKDHHALSSAPAQKIYQIKSQICSANAVPTARIAGPASQSVIGIVGQEKTVTLDGSLSTDPEGPIAQYTWSCGNGNAPVVVAGSNGAIVTCAYLVQAASHNYTATLVVTDAGIGGSCQQSSTAASVQLIVSP